MSMCWYVVRSKPNKEDFFYDQLLAHRLEVFYPRVPVKVINPRARKVRPYFPGYLFVHVDLDEINLSVLHWMPGSAGLVAFDAQPASVPDHLIVALRRKVEEINLAGGEQLAGLQPGDTVVIQVGPFAGYEALFDTSLAGKERVRVLLKYLRGKQMPLELPTASIEKKKQRS
jgi:transcription antitermination factor NusG